MLFWSYIIVSSLLFIVVLGFFAYLIASCNNICNDCNNIIQESQEILDERKKLNEQIKKRRLSISEYDVVTNTQPYAEDLGLD